MHREYRPSDMDHLRAHAFGAGGPHHDHDHDHDHHHHDHAHDAHDHDHGHHHDDRFLYGLTALMGLLLGGELLFGWLGWEAWRAPGGVSLALMAALIGGSHIVYGALEALWHGRIGADVALAQACLAALAIGQPFVAAEVVFIALVGEVLEAVTFSRAQRAIHRLLDQTPRTARVRRDGEEREVAAAEVLVGDTVVVRPGERVPVDGPILVGRTTVDQSMLTGESIAVDKGPGEPVFTGTVNQFGQIDVRAEKVGHQTTLGQVLKIVADAQRRKAPLERTADRLARYFLPVVEVVAGLTLAAGYLLGWPDVWFRTVAVLVVACPCALILATPAAVLASMAWLARHGVLIKGGAALERLAACNVMAFDKTGTLTLGRPEVASVVPLAPGLSESDVVRLAATAEASSPHPLAQAVAREAERRALRPAPVEEAVALPGAGVSARYREVPDGPDRHLLVGNRRLLTEHGTAIDEELTRLLDAVDARGETPLIVVHDGAVAGVVGARDTVRPEAHDVVHDLKHLGFKPIAILTGDRASAARAVAKKVHIGEVEAELLPADKARWVVEAQSGGRRVAMIGDGINDAPALAAAHVGIALGGIGADLAAEAGDLVLLVEPLRVLPDLVKLSRLTVRIIRQNILGFAFGLNAVAMTSAALGWLGPVAAAVLHQAGSFLVLLNAMRLLVFGDWASVPPIRQARVGLDAVARFDDRVDLGRAFSWALARWRTAAALGILGGFAAYLTSNIVAVEHGEVVLVERFGRHVATLGPGLAIRWPAPIESVHRLRADEVRSLPLGFRPDLRADATGVRWESSHGRGQTAAEPGDGDALLLSGDGRLVELSATVQYRLDASDPAALRAYAFGVAEPERALRPIAEAAIRSVVSRSSLEPLLTRGRAAIEAEAMALIRERVAAYRLGLAVTAVAFQDVHPPRPVVDAYRDVSRAGSDAQRRTNEGRTYQAEVITRARGQADARREQAEADKAASIARAGGEAESFRLLAAAHATRPDLLPRRLYWDAVEAVMANKPKILLDPGRAAPRHLMLPELGGDASPPAPLLMGPPRPAAAVEPRSQPSM